ncbi:hypothetical protein RvY_02867-2, partial [Ramazzottius varieornatus]
LGQASSQECPREPRYTASDNHIARLIAVSDSNSGSWHQALPSLPLDSLLDSNSSRIGVGLRLGAKLSRAHKCRCGANVDGYGQHGLSCSFSGGRYSRHSALNESLKRALTLAQISAILDPPGIFRKNKRRPDGMTQVPWKNGKELVWDVGVVDTLTNFAMSLWKPDQLLMLPKRERFPSIEISEVSFCSALLVWSPLGHRPCATKLFEAIGRNTMEVTGESRSFTFVKQRVSINIQRANPYSVFSTLQDTKGLDELVFVLDVKNGKSVHV